MKLSAFRAAAVVVCACTLAGAAHAQQTQVSLLFHPAVYDASYTGPYARSTSGSGPVSDSMSVPGGQNSSGSGSGFADWGVIKVLATASGGMEQAVAGGFYSDIVTFAVAGVATGAMIDIAFAQSVSGQLWTNDSGFDDVLWNFKSSIQYQGAGGASMLHQASLYGGNSSAFHGSGGDAFGTFTAHGLVPNNTPLLLKADLQVTVQTAYDPYNHSDPGTPAAGGDLSHSVYWGGITSVAYNGAPVAGWSVSSASGFDYAQPFAPVPEPAPAALLAAGLAFVSVLRRTRARGSRPATSATAC